MNDIVAIALFVFLVDGFIPENDFSLGIPFQFCDLRAAEAVEELVEYQILEEVVDLYSRILLFNQPKILLAQAYDDGLAERYHARLAVGVVSIDAQHVILFDGLCAVV